MEITKSRLQGTHCSSLLSLQDLCLFESDQSAETSVCVSKGMFERDSDPYCLVRGGLIMQSMAIARRGARGIKERQR